jgi:hypothetical protein
MADDLQTPTAFLCAIRTALSADEVRSKISADYSLQPAFYKLVDGSVVLLGPPPNGTYAQIRTGAYLDIWKDAASGCFGLSIVPANFGLSDAANAYLDLRQLILNALKATVVITDVVQEIMVTLHAERWELNLEGQQLTDLPSELGLLACLESLNLSHNRLTQLPAEITSLTKLEELYASNNQLTSLPQDLGRLTDLTRLSLSGNQIESLPASIGQLAKLEKLELNDNKLSRLPGEICELTNLRHLWIKNNRLTELPTELHRLEKLRDWDFTQKNKLPPRFPWGLLATGNPLVHPPPEVLKQGSAAVRAYLKKAPVIDNGRNRSVSLNPFAVPAVAINGIRVFSYELNVENDDGPVMEAKLKIAFPELAWQDQAENWGKIRLEGLSAEKPPNISIYIVRKEAPGPFQLRLHFRDTAIETAEKSNAALCDRVVLALG